MESKSSAWSGTGLSWSWWCGGRSTARLAACRMEAWREEFLFFWPRWVPMNTKVKDMAMSSGVARLSRVFESFDGQNDIEVERKGKTRADILTSVASSLSLLGQADWPLKVLSISRLQATARCGSDSGGARKSIACPIEV